MLARRYSWPTLLALVIVAIGVVDYTTGPDVGFSLFYLVPIVAAGWRVGHPAALLLALLATGAWLTADFAWRGVNAVSLWNGFTRFGIYVSMAWLTSRVRSDREELLALNARLSLLLAEEEQRARSDALTGLPNHRLFMDELRRAAARSDRAARPIVVGYLDLDNFKNLNDLYGRVAGDEILRRVSEILTSQLRTGDLAARLGGDEFGLLIADATFEAAKEIGHRILTGCESLASNYPGSNLGITGGLVCFDTPQKDTDTLLHIADASMYRAKREGKHRVVVERAPDRQTITLGTPTI